MKWKLYYAFYLDDYILVDSDNKNHFQLDKRGEWKFYNCSYMWAGMDELIDSWEDHA